MKPSQPQGNQILLSVRGKGRAVYVLVVKFGGDRIGHVRLHMENIVFQCLNNIVFYLLPL